MFRDRPLTWLFVAATICVDWVLMTLENDRDLLLSLKVGLVLGQLAALAIWSVRGDRKAPPRSVVEVPSGRENLNNRAVLERAVHRLARVACLILATGLLTYLIDAKTEKSTWIAFNAAYVFWTIFVTLLSDAIRTQLRKRSSENILVPLWRVPLIEFFGWTTVIAIISFGARHMNFDFLRQGNDGRIFIAVLAVPTCMTLFARRDLYDLLAFKAITLALVIIMAVLTLAKTEGGGKEVVAFQSAYLVMCLPILGMDDIRSRKKNARTEKPQLFDPQG